MVKSGSASVSLPQQGVVTRSFDSIAVALCVLFVVVLGARGMVVLPQAWQLKPNAFAVLSLVEVTISFLLLVLLLRRRGDNLKKQWLAVFLGFEILWGVAEYFQRLSALPEGALMWTRLTYVAVALLPMAFYLFIRDMTAKNEIRQDILTPAVLLFTSIVMVAAVMTAPIPLDKGVILQPWGYLFTKPEYLTIMAAWATAVISLALLRLNVSRLNDDSVMRRRQAVIIMAAAGLSMLVTVIVDLILPLWGIHVLPLGVLINSLMPAAVLYTMYRYDTFALDFTTIASDVVEALGEAVVVTDEAFVIRWTNHRVEELSGFVAGELKSKPMASLIDGDLLPGATVDFGHRGVSETLTARESTLTTKLGSTLNVSVSVRYIDSPVRAYVFVLSDVTGLVTHYSQELDRAKELESANQAFRDQQEAMLNLLDDARELEEQLTAEKAGVEAKIEDRTAELEGERKTLSSIINGVDVGIYLLDKSLSVTLVNAPMKAIFETVAGAPYSIEAFNAYIKKTPYIEAAIRRAVTSGKPVIGEQDQAGKLILRTYRAPIFEGTDKTKHLTGVVVLVQDISEAKAQERSRDEFFSIASHELRTPLTAIRGNTSMIKEFYPEQIKDPMLSEMVDDIHNSSIRLINLVNDFLDTSRLEQGKIVFNLTAFDPADLALDVQKEFVAGGFNAKVPINLKVAKSIPVVMADHDRLKQVIINLVGNAVKFTDTGSVTIAVAKEKGFVTLRVTDTGKGIPDESRHLLFRKFQQASNNILTRDSTQSTGLGLYISRLIMIGMGGGVELESTQLGTGSTFVARVPVAPASATVPQPGTSLPTASVTAPKPPTTGTPTPSKVAVTKLKIVATDPGKPKRAVKSARKAPVIKKKST